MPFPRQYGVPIDPKNTGIAYPGSFNDPRVIYLLQQMMKMSPQASNYLGSRFSETDSPFRYPDIGFMKQNSPPLKASLMDLIGGNIKPSAITMLKAKRKGRKLLGSMGQVVGGIAGGSPIPVVNTLGDDLYTKAVDYTNEY